mmetsp:Transcript_37516/g.43676  ORF Transcript_37516/g.43676 Transcript_37516/m.43676 type:complete len:247 (+) Transcript_37516:29-769(+)
MWTGRNIVNLFWIAIGATALQPHRTGRTPFELSTRYQQSKSNQSPPQPQHELSRRSIGKWAIASLAATYTGILLPTNVNAKGDSGIALSTTPNGLKWGDAKVGSGTSPKPGSVTSIDYAMSATGGRSPKIYSTQESGAPYRWTLGDGSTIAGIEQAILGDADGGGIPPMLPGGIRRLVIPADLGYIAMSAANAKCAEGGKDGAVGPIPPKEGGAYERFTNLYCNPRIPYQPDLVLDIKLYGKRTAP